MRLLTFCLALGLSSLAIAATDAEPDGRDPDWDDCQVVHIAPDGSRTESPPLRATARSSDSGAASAAAQSRGGSQSRVSVSASSGGGGPAQTAAQSRADGRSVTVTRNEQGCTVVIDARGG